MRRSRKKWNCWGKYVNWMSSQINNFVRLKLKVFVTNIFWIVCFDDPNWVINCLLTKKTTLLETHTVINKHVRSRKNSSSLFKNFSCHRISSSWPWSKCNLVTSHTYLFIKKFDFSRNKVSVLLHFWKILTQKNWFQMLKVYNWRLICCSEL